MNTPRLEPNAGSERLITMVTQDIPEGYKRCSRCKAVLPIEDFYKASRTKDGRQTNCINCARDVGLQWKRANAQVSRDYSRQRRKDNPEEHRENARLYRQRHPEKVKETIKVYRENNPDRVKDSGRRYREENKDMLRVRNQEWRQKNPDHLRAKKREWRQNNSKRVMESSRRRRLSKLQIPTIRLSTIRDILLVVQKGKCLYCGNDLDQHFHVDHIIPLSLAPLLGNSHPGHTPSNFLAACPHCNVSKHNYLLEDWLAWKYPDQMDEILHRVDRHIALMTELWEKCGENEELWWSQI